jgi:tRNA 2-thiouridine synthesizing protein A
VSQIEVDARGLSCPLPVIRLATVARNAPAGTVITVLATDPAARHDVPAWCRMRHHELLEVTDVTRVTDPSAADPTTAGGAAGAAGAAGDPAYLRFVVVVRGQPAK